MSEFALVVIAGGDSRRMRGRHKALLPVPPDGHPLIDHIVGTLAPLSQAVVAVANKLDVQEAVATRRQSIVTVVPDLWPGAGAMGGIATGLMYCKDWAVVTACDTPFVNPGLFELLCRFAVETDGDNRRRWDGVVPRVHGYPQMLHTLYHVDMLPHFRQCISAGDLKLLNVLPAARVRYVLEEEMTPLDPGLRSFTNVNTPSEWEDARTALEAAARSRQ